MKCLAASLFIASGFLSSPALAQVGPKVYRDAEQAFLERTSLRAADDKCQYFTDLERSALISGQLQSRGELLRSGVFSLEEIDRAAEEVTRYANSRDCGNADFANAAGHLSYAFAAFVGTMVMEYPGLIATWKTSRSRWDTWRAVQSGTTDEHMFEFGLLAPVLSDPDDFPASFSRPLDAPLQTEPFDLAVDLFLETGAAPPSKARLLIRDLERAPDPWLGNLFGTTIAPPPTSLTKAYWPTSREIIEDEEKETQKLRFRFSPEATAAIEALDPREQFQIAVFPDVRSGEQDPDYITIEAGDFAAAHAFTKLPPL